MALRTSTADFDTQLGNRSDDDVLSISAAIPAMDGEEQAFDLTEDELSESKDALKAAKDVVERMSGNDGLLSINLAIVLQACQDVKDFPTTADSLLQKARRRLDSITAELLQLPASTQGIAELKALIKRCYSAGFIRIPPDGSRSKMVEVTIRRVRPFSERDPKFEAKVSVFSARDSELRPWETASSDSSRRICDVQLSGICSFDVKTLAERSSELPDQLHSIPDCIVKDVVQQLKDLASEDSATDAGSGVPASTLALSNVSVHNPESHRLRPSY
jgi:hypothetical protein